MSSAGNHPPCQNLRFWHFSPFPFTSLVDFALSDDVHGASFAKKKFKIREFFFPWLLVEIDIF